VARVKQVLEALGGWQIKVRGVVQGVGFRPFIYRIAIENCLNGYVLNTSGDVTIKVEGTRDNFNSFLYQLRQNPPPQSHIESVDIKKKQFEGYTRFEIRQSRVENNNYLLISPDLATCSECITEILDPENRRYGYPFTNCTNCGPRFTIIEGMPYDRPQPYLHLYF